METRYYKTLGPILSIGAIPFLLVCVAIAVALMLRSTPAAIGGESGQGRSAADMGADSAYDNTDATVAPATPSKGRCATCGVIESVKEVQDSAAANSSRQMGSQRGNNRELASRISLTDTNVDNKGQPAPPSARRYEVTVRMKDGSTRILSERDSPSWRVGRKVILIDGNGDV